MLIVLAIIATFLIGVTAALLHYASISARTRVAVNLVSARSIIEDVIRYTGEDDLLNNRIVALREKPGFENIVINNDEPLERTVRELGGNTVYEYQVLLKDELLGREEVFYVYRFR